MQLLVNISNCFFKYDNRDAERGRGEGQGWQLPRVPSSNAFPQRNEGLLNILIHARFLNPSSNNVIIYNNV
jgi:hypothetical protein